MAAVHTPPPPVGRSPLRHLLSGVNPSPLQWWLVSLSSGCRDGSGVAVLGVLGLVFGGVLRGPVVRCCVVECWVVGWLGGWVVSIVV